MTVRRNEASSIEPYYEDADVTIYHADCRDLDLTVPYAVTITDPPYGSSYYSSDRDAFTADLVRRWIANGKLAVFGWPEALAALCVAIERTPDEWVCWHPTNARMRGMNLHGLWRESEHIAVFGHGEWGRLRQPRVVTTTPMPQRGTRIKDATGDVRMGDVWSEPSPNLNPRQYHRRHHPNEKPVAVMERLILSLTEPGQVVIDPFMGSGTTLLAARNLGRKAIGVDVAEEYCAKAVSRLAQVELAA